jgi:hypothetical protein
MAPASGIAMCHVGCCSNGRQGKPPTPSMAGQALPRNGILGTSQRLPPNHPATVVRRQGAGPAATGPRTAPIDITSDAGPRPGCPRRFFGTGGIHWHSVEGLEQRLTARDFDRPVAAFEGRVRRGLSRTGSARPLRPERLHRPRYTHQRGPRTGPSEARRAPPRTRFVQQGHISRDGRHSGVVRGGRCPPPMEPKPM